MTSPDKMPSRDALQDTAIATSATQWFVRQQSADMSADDWLAYSDWLGEDERHARAMDAMVALDDELDGLDPGMIASPQPSQAQPSQAELGETAPDQTTLPVTALRSAWNWRRSSYGIVAIAATVLFALLMWPVKTELQFETIATGPGETRVIMLDDTTRIELNGATLVDLARGDAPLVRLHSGEVAFFINAPTPSKLRVEVGALTLVDRGTSFDVIRDEVGIRLAVGSGQVVINPEAEAISLASGETFTLSANGGPARRSRIDPQQMASWRSGRLIYRDSPLPMLAADLSRALGVSIVLDPSISHKRFTGVVTTKGDARTVISGAAAMIGAQARRDETGWVMSAP